MKYRFTAGLCVCVAANIFFTMAVSQAKTTYEDGALKENGNTAGAYTGTEGLNQGFEIRDVDVNGAVAGYPENTQKLSGGIQIFLETLTPDDSIMNMRMSMAPDEEGDALTLDEELEEVLQAENEYADFAIANVRNYVNVRQEPTTESKIVGKIYSGAVAHVLSTAGENGDWFQIVSGNVEGYIKAEYFLYGDDAATVIDDYVTRYATVLASRLNVRKEPDIESSRLGYIDSGEKVKILENLGEWLKVQYIESNIGYVAAEYVTVSEEFVYAKTLEEEAKEIAERKALEERQRASEKETAENTSINAEPPVTAYSSNAELRQQIVDYAMQYLGNKYVHGGKSLSGGTDCSGFTSLIYAEFGYSLSRTPSGQLSGSGRSIDYSEIQPGDVICYGSKGTCTHVGLYIGNGQIIHSANSRKGVIISNAGFDTILGVKNIID